MAEAMLFDGKRNPMVIISREEFHDWLRSKVDETELKGRTMDAVQITFVDPRTKQETHTIQVPNEIAVMCSNVVEAKESYSGALRVYHVAPPPTPEETTEHIIEQLSNVPFPNDQARQVAIALVREGKYKVIPYGYARIEIKE